MLNHFLVEAVLGKIFSAGKKRELIFGDKSKQEALDGAVGTITLDHIRQIGFNLKLDCLTVAVTSILCHNHKRMVTLLVYFYANL